MYKIIKGLFTRGSPQKLLIYLNCRGPGPMKGLRRARDDVANGSLARSLTSAKIFKKRRVDLVTR